MFGGAAILPPDSLFAYNLAETGMDKLADDQGNFIQTTSPLQQKFS